MKVSQIDPRDERWQDIGPVFGVYFWQKLGETSYASDEFEVCDADVIDVLRWAERERGDRTFTLYLRRE